MINKKKVDLLCNMSGDHNVSKQVYDVFQSEKIQTQTFYADFETLKEGELKLSISKFTQIILSDFVKNIPEKMSMVVTFEYPK